MSISPTADMSSMQGYARQQHGDFNYGMPNPGSLPAHMRNEYNQHSSSRSSPNGSGSNSPGLSGFQQSQSHRQPMTSHPTAAGYSVGHAPPMPMEPPTQQERTPTGSPHMSHLGWQSPTSAGLNGSGVAISGNGSGVQGMNMNMNGGMNGAGMNGGVATAGPPGQSHINHDGYGAFPDQFAFQQPPLYYPNSHMRRPQSTEPDQYEAKPNVSRGMLVPGQVGQEVWATHM